MGTSMIFYLASTALALYAAWLLAFRTYRTDEYDCPTDERITFPNIVYILLFAFCFTPILNFIFFLVFIVAALAGRYLESNFYVRSWLFDEPGQEEEDEKED